MKNYVLPNGQELDVMQMMAISKFYDFELTKEYLTENLDHLSLSENVIEQFTAEVREYIEDCDEPISEVEAINDVLLQPSIGDIIALVKIAIAKGIIHDQMDNMTAITNIATSLLKNNDEFVLLKAKIIESED